MPTGEELAPWEAELLESARQEAERQEREADTPIYFEAYAAMRERFWQDIGARAEAKQEDRDSKRAAAIARAQQEGK